MVHVIFMKKNPLHVEKILQRRISVYEPSVTSKFAAEYSAWANEEVRKMALEDIYLLRSELYRCRTTENAAAHALDIVRQYFSLDLIPGEHPSDTAKRIRNHPVPVAAYPMTKDGVPIVLETRVFWNSTNPFTSSTGYLINYIEVNLDMRGGQSWSGTYVDPASDKDQWVPTNFDLYSTSDLAKAAQSTK